MYGLVLSLPVNIILKQVIGDIGGASFALMCLCVHGNLSFDMFSQPVPMVSLPLCHGQNLVKLNL